MEIENKNNKEPADEYEDEECEDGGWLEGEGLSTLPVELHEYICGFLEGYNLGVACCVNKKWNRAISSFHGLWQKKCYELGTGPLVNKTDTWKALYFKYWPIFKRIENGTAFLRECINTSHFLRGPSYTALAYCRGYVFAAEGSLFGIWRIRDNRVVGVVFVDNKVSCLCASPDGQVLAAGCHGGLIKTWSLNAQSNRFMKHSLKEYNGHTNNVLCIHLSTECDLLVSGAHDGTAKLWCLSTGQLLKSLPATSYVGQATLYPCIGSVNMATLFKEKHSLLIMDDADISVYSWPIQGEGDCKYGDISSIENDTIVFYKQEIGARRSRYHIYSGLFYYIQGTMISVYCLLKKVQLNKIELGFVNGDLLAVGDKYAMVTLWDSAAGEMIFSVVSLVRRKLFGRVVIPGLVTVAVGERDWMSSLADRKYGDVIFVATDINIQENPHINVFLWRDLQEAATAKSSTLMKIIKSKYRRFKQAITDR